MIEMTTFRSTSRTSCPEDCEPNNLRGSNSVLTVEDNARMVKKNGMANFKHRQLSWGNPLYTPNAVLLKWVPIVQMFIMAFFGTWLLFGIIYYLREWVNGNICLGPGPGEGCGEKTTNEIEETQCVVNVFNFPSALLFSVETMTTIGYGHRALTGKCPFINIVAIFQSLLGVILTGIVTGLLMSKFERPSKRKHFIWFSSRAVVMLRNRQLFLVVKVADTLDKKLEGVTTTGLLVSPSTTTEGEFIPTDFSSLSFGVDRESEDLPFLWPVCIAHKIDQTSPLFHMDPDKIATFEILLWVNGTTSSGGDIKARTSYLPAEIVWGATFPRSRVIEEHESHLNVGRARMEEFDIIEEGGVAELPRCSPATMQIRDIID